MAPEFIVLFSAMTPFIEMKLAIPLGLKLGLSGTSTFLFAVTGSIIPAAITLALANPALKLIRKHSKFLDTFFTKLFHKTHHQHSKNFNRYGAFLITSFVAIPLPGSGSTAGALIAFVFGVDYWKALALVTLGTAIGGLLLTAGFESVFKLVHLFG